MREQNEERSKKPRRAQVDDWLLERLDPPRQSVERVIRRALQQEPNPRPDHSHLGRRLLAAAATVSAVAIAVTLVVRDRNGTHQDGALVPTITNESGRVELIRPSPVRDQLSEKEPSRLSGPPVIFNEAGVIAAIIPGKEPRLLLRGGKS